MRLLVHGPSIDAEPSRLALAIAGLAQRGHELAWWRGGSPLATRDVRPIESLSELQGARAELVLGGGRHPWRPALAGWITGAHAMVLGLSHAEVAGWGVLDRWAWSTLYAVGMVEAVEQEPWSARPLGLDRDRLGLWADAAPGSTPDPAHPDVEVLERACERAIVRHRVRAHRAAVFVDRDGTLIHEVGYLADPDQVELIPGAADAIKDLHAAGFPVIVISNQSGVARGLLTLRQALEIMARMRRRLRQNGVELDAVYLCPHHPDAGCPCRKPRSGLLERAAEDQLVALRGSVMIGDKCLDAATGQRAGGRGILVRTGYGATEERRIGLDATCAPDHVCDDLRAAAAWWAARA